MTHVDEGKLQAFLDGELIAAERVEVMRHLAGCTACAAELETLRSAAQELSAALARLDRAAPVDSALVAVRAAAAPPVLRLGATRRYAGGVAGTRTALIRAAMLVLGLAAAASAAIPGSPVRAWLSEAWQRVAGSDVNAPSIAETPAPEMEAVADDQRLSGLSILPRDGEVRILVESPAPDCLIRIRLVDAAQASVYTVGAAADARFRTGPGRVFVSNAGPGEIRIDLPRLARVAVVEIDGRAVVVKRADVLRPLAPTLEAADAELVFRAGL